MTLQDSVLGWVQEHTILRRGVGNIVNGKWVGLVSDNEALEELLCCFEEPLKVLTDTAKLNCAKGPSGKHYKDPVYCGECISCRARVALRDL